MNLTSYLITRNGGKSANFFPFLSFFCEPGSESFLKKKTDKNGDRLKLSFLFLQPERPDLMEQVSYSNNWPYSPMNQKMCGCHSV
jgi:hypothetical protein